MKTFIKKLSSSNKDRLFFSIVFFIFLFFLLRGIELSLSIGFGIAPDELEHIKISELFSRSSFPIQDTPETFVYGALSRTPYLFYLIMGTFLKFNYYGLDENTVLRIVNVFFSLGTLFFIFKTSKLITKSRIVQGLSVIVASNIPMFTFLSASISYDNLANLLASISIYYALRLYKNFTLMDLMVLVISLCLGVLTKVTLLPLVVSIGIIALIIIWRERHQLKHVLVVQIKSNTFTMLLLTSLTIFAMFLAFNLYFVNIYKYRAIIPTCIQVTTYENCSRNPTFTRDEELVQNRPEGELIDPYHYLDPWQELMLRRTVGIFGHQSLYKSERMLVAYELLLVLSILSLARNVDRKKKEVLLILFVFLSYATVLAYYQNYSSYKNIGLIHVALQGRYIFPVLGPLVILFSYALINITKHNLIRITLLVITTVVFILGDYVYFKRNVPDSWYIDSPRAEVIRESNEIFK